MTLSLDGAPSVLATSVSGRSEPLEPAVLQRSLRRDLGFWLCMAGLVLSCFAGHWRDVHVPVPVDRVLLILGLLIEWRRAFRARELPRLTTASVLLLAAAAWAGLSFVGSPVRSSEGLFFLVDLYVLPAVLFISAPILLGTRQRRFAFAATFTVFGVYLGLTAITQTLKIPALVFPSYILDPAVGIHIDRARGPYVEAVNDGIMLIFSGTLGGFVATVARSPRWRAAGAACALLTAIGCALTLTRSIWFAGAAVLLVALALVPGLRRRLPVVLVGIAVLAGVFLLVFPDFATAATARGESQSPIWDRLNVNAAALRMAIQEPLFGVGWNQAGLRMSEFIRMGSDYPVTAASANLIPHNVVLGRFAELGVPGASLWIAGVIAAVVLPVLRRARPGFGAWRVVLLCFTLCWLIVAMFGPVNYSEPSYLLYLVGGVAALGRARQPVPWDWRPRAAAHRGAHRG